MKDKRILYVSSEVIPYLPETEIASMSFDAPQMVNSKGGQIRIFMPRYGNINERRHQLHEVIRLSGMNLVINDFDMPLIIKVASIPKERIQVYFIDNEEYFKRKATFTDEDGNLFKDNDERAIFFAKGVVETVKKLNWAPDIIHVHGWLASLLPLYLKKYYASEPLFKESKIVMSVYNSGFNGTLNEELIDKIAFDGIDKVMEGAFRPGHFEGVGTVLSHLFEIVKPDKAFFGEKDFQQLQIIKKLVAIEQIPVEIIGAPINRNEDGLAQSSRNVRLTPEHREAAPFIYKILKQVREDFNEKSIDQLKQWVEEAFAAHELLKLEYFEIADQNTLKPAKNGSKSGDFRAFIAVFAGDIRLIDTLSLT